MSFALLSPSFSCLLPQLLIFPAKIHPPPKGLSLFWRILLDVQVLLIVYVWTDFFQTLVVTFSYIILQIDFGGWPGKLMFL